MPNVSIEMIKKSNRMLSQGVEKAVTSRTAKLSQNSLNTLMQKAFERLFG